MDLDQEKIEYGISLLGLLYGGAIYFLPPKRAKKLIKWVDKIPILGKILNSIANTPAGFKLKDKRK